MPGEKEDQRRISLAFDLWVVDQAECKFRQDLGSSGLFILEQADIILGHTKTALIIGPDEEFMEGNRIVNCPSEM
jgi:hypothetical protein